MFRVERTEFLDQVWEVSQRQSVLLTGSPGVGKSWTVAQFARKCKTEQRPQLALAAEDFDVTSIDELTSALGFKRDVVPFLESLGGSSVLIIDGLDALRGERSQRVFRELIRCVAERIPQCAVIVSIRTFDFEQSEELQNLFSSVGLKSQRGFRHLTVLPFTEKDLATVASQVPPLSALLDNCGAEFRQLLLNPFNLHIAVQLLEAGTGAGELSILQSQVQLLTKYWQLRVEQRTDGIDREALLRQLVQNMVSRKTLSVPENAFFIPGLSPTFAGLRSDEILRESVTDRVSFTHNILFDYAVSKLLLDEDSINDFIAEDESRTIFFRPSLMYFFHRLWHQERQLFWKVADSFADSATLPERAKILPAIVVFQATLVSEDLRPLIAGANASAIATLLRAVHAFNGLQSNRRHIWLSVLVSLTSKLSLEFVNEYVALLNVAADVASDSERPVIGDIARKLLNWIWEAGRTLRADRAILLAGLGAGRVLPIVLRYYDTDRSASREVVTALMDRYGLPISSSNEAFWLAHELKHLSSSDPTLAIEVYRRTFEHKEESDETTSVGGGVVMTLTSTRRQDFSSALYGLQVAYKDFFEKAPVEASIAATESVIAEIARERIRNNEPAREFAFTVGDRKLSYRSDFSEIWDSGSREYISLQLLDFALRSAGELLADAPNDGLGSRIIDAISLRATHGVVWKHLFEAASFNCRPLYPHVKVFLTIPELIAAPETTIAAGNLLKAAYSEELVTEADSVRIENAILWIPQSQVIVRYEKPESIRARLLMCIPQEQIRTAEARDVAEVVRASEHVRENKPYNTVSVTNTQFTTEDWLREQGVDTVTPENVEALDIIRVLQNFENRFVNNVPEIEDCRAAEERIRRLDELLKHKEYTAPLSDQARGTLCAVAEAVLKNQKLSPTDKLWLLCRSIVLKGANDDIPRFDAKLHETFDMPSWGSPLPRIEAAQGLSHLVWNWGSDPEVDAALIRLSKDPVPAVRFQITSGILGFYKHGLTEQFWNVLTEMILSETTTGVMLGLMSTLANIGGREPQKILAILETAIEKGLPSSERSELTRSVVNILVGLYVVRNELGAKELLLRFETKPHNFQKELMEVITLTSPYLNPVAYDSNARARARELYERITMLAQTQLRKVLEDPTITNEDKSGVFKELLQLLDEVVTRMYFALDVNPHVQREENALSNTNRRDLYFELKPIIRLVSMRPAVEKHYLAPHTAHYLMEMFTSVLQYDPSSVAQFAAAVCKASSALSYQFDSMAIGELVKLVDQILADHKDILKDEQTATAVGEMLDIFVRAGWPQAMQMTFRLDDAVR